MCRNDPDIEFKVNRYHIVVRSSIIAPPGKYDTISIKDSSNTYVKKLWKSRDSNEWTMDLDHCNSFPTQNEVDEWIRKNLKVDGVKGLLKRIGMRDRHFVCYPEWVEEGFFFI